jgi:vacuolar-type H+-ATPase subunit E/Vma4
MPELSEAVLGKVRDEADATIRQAREDARQVLERARRQRQERIEAASTRRLAEAGAHAAQIIALGRMEARRQLASARSEIIQDLLERTREALDSERPTAVNFARLVHDAIDGLEGAGKNVIVCVGPADLDMARQLVATDQRLARIVKEVAEGPSGGGVLVETEDGSTAVDNRYASRLEMLVPRVLPRLGRELFRVSHR